MLSSFRDPQTTSCLGKLPYFVKCFLKRLQPHRQWCHSRTLKVDTERRVSREGGIIDWSMGAGISSCALGNVSANLRLSRGHVMMGFVMSFWYYEGVVM